jgi:DNA-binding response OmpR family regulator
MKKAKILIVDDDTEFSTMFSTFLNENGFETEVSQTGRDGFKKAISWQPDLILLDYHLPDMSGYDVAMALRCQQNTSKIPLIVLSSFGADTLLVVSFEKLPACKGVLVKTQPMPVIFDAIMSAIPGDNN